MGWKTIPPFIADQIIPQLRISIIVAARNEEKVIGRLLKSLTEQTYPSELYEIIVVDDHSTDATAKIVQHFSKVRLIQLEENNLNSYKKKAIETGIAGATGDWIVTTDADCVAPPNWLLTIASFKEKINAVFIAAPVVMETNRTILQNFQALDFLTMQGITAASVQYKFHTMCNGANLSFEKKVFDEVGGFTNIDHISSGDDMFLMHKIAQIHPSRVSYLHSKDALINTEPQVTWNDFFQQRIRWASKATHYKDINIFVVLVLVYVLNLFLFFIFLVGFWQQKFWIYFVFGATTKAIIEWLLVHPVAKFYGKQHLIKFLFLYQPLHIIYVLLAGWLGTFGNFEWKGRTVK